MGVDATELARFYPLDSLRPENLEQLAQEATIEEHGRGTVLFAAGDVDAHTLYLVAGAVRGQYPSGKVKRIDGASLQGRYPLGDLQPRRYSAVVDSLVATVARLNRRFCAHVQTWDQLTRLENFRHCDANPDANRWIWRLLQNRALYRMPTANIEQMFLRFEAVPARAGDVIVREGDPADFFYVIKAGTCAVSKQTRAGAATVAYLVRGDTFGEDALLTNTTRNATIVMKTDGILMRLSERDFGEVMMPPMVDWVTPGQASIMVRQGAAILDVRTPEEFAVRAVKGAVNVPLDLLREEAGELERGRKLVVYCNTGERSAAAAFILAKLGLDAFALQGGLVAMIRQIAKQSGEKPPPPL